MSGLGRHRWTYGSCAYILEAYGCGWDSAGDDHQSGLKNYLIYGYYHWDKGPCWNSVSMDSPPISSFLFSTLRLNLSFRD